jgi:hypothetical protein
MLPKPSMHRAMPSSTELKRHHRTQRSVTKHSTNNARRVKTARSLCSAPSPTPLPICTKNWNPGHCNTLRSSHRSGIWRRTPQPQHLRRRPDFTHILTNFAPRAKQRGKMSKMPQDGEIDILIATDCISEGQNLQDCDYLLVNYDIHWNPVRIIQRFGRIDRIGSPNECHPARQLLAHAGPEQVHQSQEPCRGAHGAGRYCRHGNEDNVLTNAKNWKTSFKQDLCATATSSSCASRTKC